MKMKSFILSLGSLLAISSISMAVPPRSNDSQAAAIQPPANAIDPTLPSAKIKQRLTVTPQKTNASSEPVASAMPSLTLKAIVLTDQDHGSALIEHAGRKFVVPLSRANDKRLDGFSIGETFMVIEDFSNSSLLIRSGNQSWLLR